MAPRRSIEDLKHQEASLHEQINRRLDALQGEVGTLGESIKAYLLDNPLVAVGGSLAAGLLVGLIFGGSRKRRSGTTRHRDLMEQYVQSLMDETRHRVAKGEDAGEAVRRALGDRVPLIVYEAPDGAGEQSVVGRVFDVLMKTSLGVGTKMGVDYLATYLMPPQNGRHDEDDDSTQTAFATAVVSEGME